MIYLLLSIMFSFFVLVIIWCVSLSSCDIYRMYILSGCFAYPIMWLYVYLLVLLRSPKDEVLLIWLKRMISIKLWFVWLAGSIEHWLLNNVDWSGYLMPACEVLKWSPGRTGWIFFTAIRFPPQQNTACIITLLSISTSEIPI